jgi:hypothetical protein
LSPKAKLLLGMVPAVLASMPGRAQEMDSSVVVRTKPGSSLTIRGSTTVGAHWHCTATNVPATAVMKSRTLRIDEMLWVTVIVPVTALRCQSGPMDRAMRKALRADRDTTMRIEGHFATDPGRPATEMSVPLVGALVVSGVRHDVAFTADVRIQADGSLRVQSPLPLTLSAFRIAPPRVLFGAIRARDAISVEVDLTF